LLARVHQDRILTSSCLLSEPTEDQQNPDHQAHLKVRPENSKKLERASTRFISTCFSCPMNSLDLTVSMAATSQPFVSVLGALKPTKAPVDSCGSDDILPRRLPLVGFLRHAPQQAEGEHSSQELHWCSHKEMNASGALVGSASKVEMTNDSKLDHFLELPRESPYVGYCRHSLPSPMLNFSSKTPASIPTELDLAELDVAEESSEIASCGAQLINGDVLRNLPMEVLALILSGVVEASNMNELLFAAHGFADILKYEEVWRDRSVRLEPEMITWIAPRLEGWLQAWRSASKILVPRSSQLVAEITRQAPALKVEVCWHFNSQLKGEGIEVCNHGRSVRRIADEELVALGDAPLPVADGQAPYFEIRLDERGECIGDGVNDFGLGVTACDPTGLFEIGEVADEVPNSWVVDFTQYSIMLSVNNSEAAKGSGSLSSKNLQEGDRVGIRLTRDGSVEVFHNGVLREHLRPAPRDRVPSGVDLFPVLDLYGKSVQISRTVAEEPVP